MTTLNDGPRIAYLLKKFPRLSETFVLNEILAQESLGRALHVFARRERDDEPLHPQTSRLRATVETLATRVQAAERRLVPEAIRLFAQGRLEIDSQRRVRIRKPG